MRTLSRFTLPDRALPVVLPEMVVQEPLSTHRHPLPVLAAVPVLVEILDFRSRSGCVSNAKLSCSIRVVCCPHCDTEASWFNLKPE